MSYGVYGVCLRPVFMAQFLTHLYFENSAEEFHPMKLSLLLWNFHHLSSSIQCLVSIFNAHKILWNSHWNWPNQSKLESTYWQVSWNIKGFFCPKFDQKFVEKNDNINVLIITYSKLRPQRYQMNLYWIYYYETIFKKN
jgi:hypothetical protein